MSWIFVKPIFHPYNHPNIPQTKDQSIVLSFIQLTCNTLPIVESNSFALLTTTIGCKVCVYSFRISLLQLEAYCHSACTTAKRMETYTTSGRPTDTIHICIICTPYVDCMVSIAASTETKPFQNTINATLRYHFCQTVQGSDLKLGDAKPPIWPPAKPSLRKSPCSLNLGSHPPKPLKHNDQKDVAQWYMRVLATTIATPRNSVTAKLTQKGLWYQSNKVPFCSICICWSTCFQVLSFGPHGFRKANSLINLARLEYQHISV